VRRIGKVAILACENAHGGEKPKYRTTDVLSSEFESLEPSDFCSLGQSADYYKRLGEMPVLGRAILEGLNDVRFTTSEDHWWSGTPGFEYSLLRFNYAHLTFRDAKALFDGKEPEEAIRTTLRFRKSDGMQWGGPDLFEVDFDGSLEAPGRLNVIVGRNGCGKTSLLAGLSTWFSRDVTRSKESFRPEFASVLVVSFNPFDEASRSWGNEHNVQHVGRQPLSRIARQLLAEIEQGDVDEDELAQNPTMIRALCDVIRASSGMSSYIDDMERLKTDEDWLGFISDAFDSSEIRELVVKEPAAAIETMSAGQRALTQLYAALFARLDQQSLVLLDEPENHLHPSLLARFIRKFNDLLELRRAFAVVATHSPIVVQETPARFVTIFEREGEVTTTRHPDFETFGESTDGICERLFQTDFKSSNWKQVLRSFAEKGLELAEVQEKISGKELPLYARTYFAFHQHSGETK
jgi:ATPase subunit of ABC transporter with duplicated ATPase domains